MTRSRTSLFLFAAAVVLVSGAAGSAAAAPATAPTSRPVVAPAPAAVAPYVVGTIEAQIWPQADSTIPTQAVVITDVTLPSDTKLPATVRIPIVPGTKVMWAGESIPGGNPDSDPQRQVREVDGAGGGKYAEFVLSKSLRGQIDSVGVPLTFSGDEVAFSVDWVQSTEATSVLFTVRFPAGSSRIQIDPEPTGAPQTNMAGESLYALPKMNLARGAKQTIKASYSTNPSGEQAVTSSTKTAVYVVLGVLLVVAIALLAFLFVRRAGSQGDGPDGGGDVGEDDGETGEQDLRDDPIVDLGVSDDSGSEN